MLGQLHQRATTVVDLLHLPSADVDVLGQFSHGTVKFDCLCSYWPVHGYIASYLYSFWMLQILVCQHCKKLTFMLET